MEGREKPHKNKHKKITNDWKYGISYPLASLPVSDLENLNG
jgi:hypothetical protein